MDVNPLKGLETLEEGSFDAEGSNNHGSTSTGTTSERDEVQEVLNVSKRETFRVSLWRLIATGVLILTAVAVTLTTYFFLNRQKTRSFETQFDQFSRKVAEAAMTQMHRARVSQWGFTRTLSAYVYENDPGAWPFFHLPLFAMYGNDLREQGQLELVMPFVRVERDELEEWETFVAQNHEEAIIEAHMTQDGNLDRLVDNATSTFHKHVYRITPEGRRVPDEDRETYWPSIDCAPAPHTYGMVNWNYASSETYGPMMDAMLEMKYEAVLSPVKSYEASIGTIFTEEEHEDMHKNLDILDGTSSSPHTFWSLPIYENPTDHDSRIVAALQTTMAWDVFMRGLLPEGVKGITVVLDNSCNQSFTFELDGPRVYYVGEGDFHDTKYNYIETYQDLMEGSYIHPNFTTTPGHCLYSLRIYATDNFTSSIEKRIPMIFAIVVASFFGMIAAVFYTYDVFVQSRNDKLVNSAARSNAIVASLFPSNIHDRLLNVPQQPADIRKKSSSLGLKGFMSGELGVDDDTKSKPLADLFLECTIMFADIAGFTAWSSMREPSQVFTILETLYGAFDQIAKSRKVLKVETVGDCYVAASGIPDYRREHAVIMVKFARDILAKMVSLTKELEVTLGPDTGDLSLRIGVHSGPVTGGVLRGERSRFQLFGDTMNVCSRVESTGTAGRIQLSLECAQQLIANGKEHWLVKREEKVQAKGKGEIQTDTQALPAIILATMLQYWLSMGVCSEDRTRASSSVSSGEPLGVYEPMEEDVTVPARDRICPVSKTSRLVDWNVQMLADILKEVLARRRAKATEALVNGRSETVVLHVQDDMDLDGMQQPDNKRQRRNSPAGNTDNQTTTITNDNNNVNVNKPNNFGFDHIRPLDEVQEIIRLPAFDAAAARRAQDASTIELESEVLDQLRDFCSNVAACYNENWFHNFAHASHVTMSVVKLLSRIVAPTESMETENALHDHTYGITSDPLTQFACAFAAMIHDVNHVGVPNSQLVKEKARIVSVFGDRSVAEQNSVVVAWELFLSPPYDLLRRTVCATDTELLRFRQLVVNSVMATVPVVEKNKQLTTSILAPPLDIVDRDLKRLRNARWEKAFATDEECGGGEEINRTSIDRKATIVMEHLIQASDVAHTMQHWHVYRKWNERFFRECMAAYLNGRAEENPATHWYKGELGFFDFYVIPLAKKLKDCGVFGKSSDEYLTYARANRAEWERRGEDVVRDMMASMERELQNAPDAPLEKLDMLHFE
eukprot:Nitzschia sp. Nitz4//scaffold229_size32011//3230//7371//NITZ4_007915-RA/size32011-processed-gene-0.6-mRNA-1//1//CDS//3329542847//7259//frame0